MCGRSYRDEGRGSGEMPEQRKMSWFYPRLTEVDSQFSFGTRLLRKGKSDLQQ